MFLWIFLFTIALFTLIKSADYFTDSAEKIGLHFDISPFIIGITIVAFGTSLPEVATSISAVFAGNPEIVIGNVLGSNIANILLVLGVTAIIAKELRIEKDIIKIDLPILMAATLLLYFTTSDGVFSWIEGIISLIGLIIYLVYSASSAQKNKEEIVKQITDVEFKSKKLDKKILIILFASAIGIFVGAQLTVMSIEEIATALNIAQSIIAGTVLAVGTSLPELVVSISAAKKGKGDMAIGNITGSNIFNALGVMGIPALFGTLTISEFDIAFTIPALIVITILYIFETMEKVITKWEGMMLVLLYIGFLGKFTGLF